MPRRDPPKERVENASGGSRIHLRPGVSTFRQCLGNGPPRETTGATVKYSDLHPLLLGALCEGPAHAAELARRVAKLTRGQVLPHSHRTAQILRAMVREGLLESRSATIVANGSPRSVNVYKLTRGALALAEMEGLRLTPGLSMPIVA